MKSIMNSLASSPHAVPTQPRYEELPPFTGRADRPTILVAEDDEVVRTAIMEVLHDAGYEGVGATDGKHALAALDLFVGLTMTENQKLEGSVFLEKPFRPRRLLTAIQRLTCTGSITEGLRSA